MTFGGLIIATSENTLASDHWTIEISYTPNTGPPVQYFHITFLPNGSIDATRTLQTDLEGANKLLAPTITSLQNSTKQSFDYWELMNWMVVSFYWSTLAVLGQLAPTTYPSLPFPPSDIIRNLSSPTTLPSTNNIFINDSLYKIYFSYLKNTVIPMLGSNLGPKINKIGAHPLTNETEFPEMTLIKSYSCLEKRIKSAVSLIVSVIAADYALIMSAYGIAIYIAAFIQTRRQRDGKLPT
jgi:hypothetical protein